MKKLLIIPFLLFCTCANAYTWRFTSEKVKADLVTKNPERTVEWCNEYYHTDDCVKTVVVEPTQEELDAQELMASLSVQISAIANQITTAIADGDDAKVAELRTQRNALKQQLQQLGN